jgi:hypothetical protein
MDSDCACSTVGFGDQIRFFDSNFLQAFCLVMYKRLFQADASHGGLVRANRLEAGRGIP